MDTSYKQHHGRTMFAVVAAILFMSVLFIPMMSDDADAFGPDESYRYVIHPDGTIEGGYTAIGTSSSGKYVSVDGANSGSWAFNEDGYGPFNSFYAAFDPYNNNRMICHLDPDNLMKSVDGTLDISGMAYNVMWCLPTVYWDTDSDGNLVLSNDPSNGTAYAHTIDGKVYEYLAIGVYEGSIRYVDNVPILASISNDHPIYWLVASEFRDYANNQTVNTSGSSVDGHAMVWNFYQWELYKYCALAVMGSWDSQSVAGLGPVLNDVLLQKETGELDSSGPYAGTKKSEDSIREEWTDSVKVFIENSWGGMGEFVDGVVVNGGYYYIDQSSVPSGSKVGTYVVKPDVQMPTIYASNQYGTDLSTDSRVWGIPTSTTEYDLSELKDTYWGTGYDRDNIMVVGGGVSTGYSYAREFGLSYINASDNNALGYHIGSRLAFVFDKDEPLDLKLSQEIDLVSGITITGKDSLNVGESIVLRATTSGDASNRDVIWSITGGSGEARIKEYRNGFDEWEVFIEAVSPGTVTITATAEDGSGVYATKTITVISPTYTVTFISNGSTHTTSTVQQGSTVPKPADPIYANHTFLGWYTSESGGTKFNFSTPITSNRTLYAHWQVNSYDVKFVSNGTTIITQTVEHGGKVSIPTQPVLEGYTFKGWSLTPQTPGTITGSVFDFNTAITADITLYAMWEGNLYFTSDPSASMNVTRSSDGSYIFDASPSQDFTTVLWDFGDGSTSTKLTEAHYFANPGTYTVKLTVYNDVGSDTVTYDVTVGEDPGDDEFPWTLIVAALLIAVVILALIIRYLL